MANSDQSRVFSNRRADRRLGAASVAARARCGSVRVVLARRRAVTRGVGDDPATDSCRSDLCHRDVRALRRRGVNAQTRRAGRRVQSMNTPHLFKKVVAAIALGFAVSSGAPLSAQVIESGYVYHRGVFRVMQDYHLGESDAVREVTVVYGNVQIDGQTDWVVRVVLGDLHLTKTAIVRVSIYVPAGTVIVDEVATIRRDLVVVGGTTTSPATFSPGGEHVIVGNQWLGDTIRGVMPWLTRGLLWGRLIVPNIGWVWS